MGRRLEDGKRVTKKTKQKDKYNRFGKNNSKHIRINQENIKLNFKDNKSENKVKIIQNINKKLFFYFIFINKMSKKRSKVIPLDDKPKRKDVIPKVIIFDKKITKKYPEFKPNLTPAQIFELGSFHDQGGYFRDIKSIFYKEILKDTWKKYTAKGKCLEGVNVDLLVTPDKYKTKKSKNELNKYKEKLDYLLKSGMILDGCVNKTHMDGYNGIVNFMMVVDHLMMIDK